MTTSSGIRLLLVALCLMGVVRLSAQQPASQGAPAAADSPPSRSYSYEAAGRRDPFVSLVRRGSDARTPAARPAGAQGLAIGEITVKGILKDRSGFIAMIQGPDSRQTHIIRAGETLMDGNVKAITGESVVFSQDVNDPLSTVKQKEVRKTIRPADGGKD